MTPIPMSIEDMIRLNWANTTPPLLTTTRLSDLDSTDAHAYFGRGLARSKLYNAQAAFRNPARKDFRTALRLATLADNQNLIARIEKELRQLDQ